MPAMIICWPFFLKFRRYPQPFFPPIFAHSLLLLGDRTVCCIQQFYRPQERKDRQRIPSLLFLSRLFAWCPLRSLFPSLVPPTSSFLPTIDLADSCSLSLLPLPGPARSYDWHRHCPPVPQPPLAIDVYQKGTASSLTNRETIFASAGLEESWCRRKANIFPLGSISSFQNGSCMISKL